MNPLLRTALEAVEAAIHIHRRDTGKAFVDQASEKGHGDFVSKTDLDAQEAVKAVILGRHPDHAILAEEDEGAVEQRIEQWGSTPVWIVDPLDGTSNFLHGHPMHAASVAVTREGRPVAGAVACASTGERWWAARGEGAFKNGRRIRVSPVRPLRISLVGTGFPFKRLDLLSGYLGELDAVLRSSSGVRRGGSAALDLCYLAQGSLDAFWESILMPWDFAAGMLIVEEAGGIVTNPEGAPLPLNPGAVRAASDPALLDELRRVLVYGPRSRRERGANERM